MTNVFHSDTGATFFQAKTQKKPVQARQKREIDRIFGR
jgi:hypothetical protein